MSRSLSAAWSLLVWASVTAASCGFGVGAPSTAPTRPLASPSSAEPPRATLSPDPATLPACSASQLRTVAAWADADDVLAGGVFIANRGTGACTLQGNPQIALLAADGSALDVRIATVTGSAAPTGIVVLVSEFREDPGGLVGAAAVAPLRWSNYCDDAPPTRYTLTLPQGAGVLEGTFVDLTGRSVAVGPTPRCDDAGESSTLAVHPFQEPRR